MTRLCCSVTRLSGNEKNLDTVKWELQLIWWWCYNTCVLNTNVKGYFYSTLLGLCFYVLCLLSLTILNPPRFEKGAIFNRRTGEDYYFFFGVIVAVKEKPLIGRSLDRLTKKLITVGFHKFTVLCKVRGKRLIILTNPQWFWSALTPKFFVRRAISWNISPLSYCSLT
jgi:hypothetical protein